MVCFKEFLEYSYQYVSYRENTDNWTKYHSSCCNAVFKLALKFIDMYKHHLRIPEYYSKLNMPS